MEGVNITVGQASQIAYGNAVFSVIAVLSFFSAPFFIMQASLARKNSRWISSVLDASISTILGMAFAHWMIRMMAFNRNLIFVMAIPMPLDTGVTVLGILAGYVVNLYLRVAYPRDTATGEPPLPPRSRQMAVKRNVPWNRGHSYVVRPISNISYVELVMISSTYAIAEGFNAGVFVKGRGHRYSSALLHQALLAFVLGVLALRTRHGVASLMKIAALLAAPMALGILTGGFVGLINLGLGVYAAFATTACVSSGMYVCVLCDKFLLLELNTRSTVRVKNMGWGFWLCAVIAYPLFDI